MSTWNVLNLENWQNQMYDVVRGTDYGSSMFFVVWIILGKYILLTLFLAVTLEVRGSGLSSTPGPAAQCMPPSRTRCAAPAALRAPLTCACGGPPW